MKQRTFASDGFEKYRKETRKDRFLREMDHIIPWKDLTGLIEPYYPKPEGAGRRPMGIEKMLRIYFLQHWYQLSDPAAEESLYDSTSFKRFVNIDLGNDVVPDETTILNFRHLMEAHGLGKKLFDYVNRYLKENGMVIGRGTIVDASIIQAPCSTKNREKKRDPDMKQTKKGNQWYFGMKTHIGIDSKNKWIHSVVVTPASVHDSRVVEDLLHGEETRVWGDSAYSGQKEAIHRKAPDAKDFTQRKGSRNRVLSETERKRNRTKSKVRAKVEHIFHILKRQFGFQKVRYRGLQKNTNHVLAACALVNLVLAARKGIVS
jgi:IS5 family transposase